MTGYVLRKAIQADARRIAPLLREKDKLEQVTNGGNWALCR